MGSAPEAHDAAPMFGDETGLVGGLGITPRAYSNELSRHRSSPRGSLRGLSATAQITRPGVAWLLPRADRLSERLLDEIQRPEGGRGRLVDLGDATLKTAPLGDHQRVGLDVTADMAGRRNLHVASGGQVAVVVSQNDGVHRLHVRVDDPLLADDQLAAHPQLAAHRALDLDRIGDLEFAFQLGGAANDVEPEDAAAVRTL